MTIGDLFDLLEEKLKTGEFGRTDSIEAVGQYQGFFEMYPIEDVVKVSCDTVQVEIEGYIGEVPATVTMSLEKQTELEERVEELEGQLEDIKEVLEEIEEYARVNSTGPALPDALWEVRRMAFDR